MCAKLSEPLTTARVLVDTLGLTASLPEEELNPRLEIFENMVLPHHYSARLWRLEHYRIQSTFPLQDGDPSHAPSDELILKEFEGLDLLDGERLFPDAITARIKFMAELQTWLERLAQAASEESDI